MIEHVLGHLAGHGIDDVVLSMGYRPDAFTDAYPDGTCAGVHLHYAVEPEPLDTAGAIRFAALDAGVDERFLVVNGDVLTDLDIVGPGGLPRRAGRRGHHRPAPGRGPVGVRRGPHRRRRPGRGVRREAAPDEAPTDLINAGTYVLEPSVLERIAGGRRVSIEREVFPAMVADGTLYATAGDTYWIDTGTPALYLQAQLDLLDGSAASPATASTPTPTCTPGPTWSRSVVGPGRPGRRRGVVEESAVPGRGARGSPGAPASSAPCLLRCRVGEGAELDDCVIGDEVEVAPGERLAEVRRPAPE